MAACANVHAYAYAYALFGDIVRHPNTLTHQLCDIASKSPAGLSGSP